MQNSPSSISTSSGAAELTSATDRPLVSPTSILILSAFLIGAVSTRLADSSLDLPVFAAGTLGAFAYFYAGYRRERNRRRAALQARATTIAEVESRFSRHVSHIAEVGPHSATARRRAMEHQYLTVVMSRPPKRAR
jgi:hypothetical protein